MICRRTILIALGACALAAPLASFAQSQAGTIPRIGLLISETLSGQANRLEALRTGLRDLGYIDGKTIAIEYRPADGNYDRLPVLAAELVRLKVDVLVAFGAKAVLAAKRATTTIPIVVPLTADPLAIGLTSSLARPSGNITGSTPIGSEVSAKRLELLKEAVPRVARVAALVNPANAAGAPALQAMRATATALKLELRPFEARTRQEIAGAFSAMAREHVDAIVVQQDTLFIANAREIAELAATQRLASAGTKEYGDAGGLIGYGASDAALYRRGAYFVDRIIKGARPGDLPFERATKFEFVLNIKIAKALGVKIPNSILVRATKVIE